MEKSIGASLAARRLTMSLPGAFAGLALVLASVGIYGVMALSTTQRTRELGIRFALGASRADVLRPCHAGRRRLGRCYLPARRASLVDPIEALRAE